MGNVQVTTRNVGLEMWLTCWYIQAKSNTSFRPVQQFCVTYHCWSSTNYHCSGDILHATGTSYLIAYVFCIPVRIVVSYPHPSRKNGENCIQLIITMCVNVNTWWSKRDWNPFGRGKALRVARVFLDASERPRGVWERDHSYSWYRSHSLMYNWLHESCYTRPEAFPFHRLGNSPGRHGVKWTVARVIVSDPHIIVGRVVWY